MKILLTGAAGFIGAATAEALLKLGHDILGIDNLNTYYEVSLKQNRLKKISHPNFHFEPIDIADAKPLNAVVTNFKPEIILNFAAQAGVRYSLKNPHAYVESNLLGFVNILELARHLSVRHLIYASSSSVYGANQNMPYKASDRVDAPLSLYAATKKSNELMAHSYQHLYGIPCTGIRFFTVYGPYGRPDMAPMKFACKIMADEPIQIYNHGEHSRDFTYIDDIVAGVVRVTQSNPVNSARVFNIGRGKPVQLLRFVELLENALGKKSQKIFLARQPGDVDHTFADITAFQDSFDYSPKISLEEGIQHFANWFLDYYQLKTPEAS